MKNLIRKWLNITEADQVEKLVRMEYSQEQALIELAKLIRTMDKELAVTVFQRTVIEKQRAIIAALLRYLKVGYRTNDNKIVEIFKDETSE